MSRAMRSGRNWRTMEFRAAEADLPLPPAPIATRESTRMITRTPLMPRVAINAVRKRGFNSLMLMWSGLASGTELIVSHGRARDSSLSQSNSEAGLPSDVQAAASSTPRLGASAR